MKGIDFLRRKVSKTENLESKEAVMKTLFSGKTVDGEVVTVKEKTDQGATLMEQLEVTINGATLSITKAERLRDGGTTVIRGTVEGTDSERLIYIPSPIAVVQQGKYSTLDGERLS